MIQCCHLIFHEYYLKYGQPITPYHHQDTIATITNSKIRNKYFKYTLLADIARQLYISYVLQHFSFERTEKRRFYFHASKPAFAARRSGPAEILTAGEKGFLMGIKYNSNPLIQVARIFQKISRPSIAAMPAENELKLSTQNYD